MSRQLEQRSEDKAKRFNQLLRKAANGGLAEAVEYAGGELTGLAFKISPWEVLLTIKADFPGGPMVGFVGAGGVGECMVKAMIEAKRDGVRWRPDKWNQNVGES